MEKFNFQKSKLAISVSLMLGIASLGTAYAQENTETENDAVAPEVEVIAVTGIRGSLMRSSDIKRDNQGVMDAIVAEEMGKFPDTNLAESLQRITGVSVSRANGEGSQITVRGFGPEFNLVTLNGRQLPSTGFSRSFNFENLASEGVSALEVFKTARADVPTGGLGATVNIVTSKPLAQPGPKMSLTTKANYDSSNVEGEDVTPEIAFLVSNTFMDDRLGLSLSTSYQRRDFQKQLANTQGWRANVDLPDLNEFQGIDARARDGEGNLVENFSLVDSEGNLSPTAAHFFPRDINYGIENFQRERFNGQATIQFQATDDLVLTADYTMSEVTAGVNTVGWGIWNNNYGADVNSYELDENGTAIFANFSGGDGSFTQSRSTTNFDMRSLGFNAEYIVNDSLTLNFDIHDSKATIDNGGDDGLRSAGQVILGSDQLQTREYSYRDGEVPQFNVLWNNGTSQLQASEIDSNFSQFLYSPGESEITQVQLDAEFLPDFDFAPSLVKVQAGIGYNDQTLTGRSATSGLRGGPGFSPSYTQIFPDGMFTLRNVSGFLDELDGGGDNLEGQYYWDYNYDEAISRQIANITADVAGENVYVVDRSFATDTTSSVTEETLSLYLNTLWEFDIADRYLQIQAGIRYEETQVVSPSESNIPLRVDWVSPSEWITTFAGIQEVENEGEYDLWLPSLDIRFDVTDDITTRLSLGKTIARAPLGDLLGGRSLSGSPRVGSRNGSFGNTGLNPYSSSNLDLSVEYYYEEGSYASVGLFWKRVDDWIESSTTEVQIEGLYDVYLGQRWNTAVSNIEGRGDVARTDAIFAEMTALGFANANGAIEPDPSTDPLITWELSTKQNVEERETNGIEVAVQHMFGETGFGVSANATFVDGDVEYDPYILSAQKALAGLSDSANFQVFYEDDDLSVRVTYAWRDEYLIGQGQAQGTSFDTPPQFAKEYAQIDMSVNYDINDQVTVFFEGINLTNETEQHYGRFEEQFLFAGQYGPRYSVGVRYTPNL